MSISNAMQTGVSGLRANSTAVGRISDNIANANTDGYRRSFAQMVTTTTTGFGGGVAPAGVRAAQGSDISLNGAVRQTGRAFDMAIGGSGFFVVTKNPFETNESNFMLTRAGSFTPDEDGNLRNAAGLYLAGFEYNDDGGVGLVDRNRFSGLTTVNVSSPTMTGTPTSNMLLSGNIPAQESGVAAPGEAFVSSAEFFSPLGVADRLQFSWQPTTTSSRWELGINASDGTPYGSVTVDFHDSGAMAGAPRAYSNFVSSAPPPSNLAFDTATGKATVTVNNGATPQVVEVSIGTPGMFDGMTQFSGDYTPLKITADGSTAGTLMRTEIDEHGDVYGVFDNGSRKALYNIPLAEVVNPDGLLATDGNSYYISRDSGGFQLSTATSGTAGSISAGALESSNVEVAQELTDLIQTQRAYSTNAKIVTTVDEMLDETTRLKR